MDLLEGDVCPKRFQGRHNRRYKKFEERRKRCIDVLTIKSTEEKQLLQHRRSFKLKQKHSNSCIIEKNILEEKCALD